MSQLTPLQIQQNYNIKNNIFRFGKKKIKQKRGNAIGTKFAPSYSILFMAELEEEIIKQSECKPYLWWRYIDDISFFWEHGENKLKSFIYKINKVCPTITFTAEWSKTSINFLDVTVPFIEGAIETDLYVKPTDSHQYLQSSLSHHFHCIPYAIAFVQKLTLLKNAVMICKGFSWKEDTVLN